MKIAGGKVEPSNQKSFTVTKSVKRKAQRGTFLLRVKVKTSLCHSELENFYLLKVRWHAKQAPLKKYFVTKDSRAKSSNSRDAWSFSEKRLARSAKSWLAHNVWRNSFHFASLCKEQSTLVIQVRSINFQKLLLNDRNGTVCQEASV